MRRAASVVALVALVLGTPTLLVRLGFYDWASLNVWAPADFRVLLGGLTAVGWAAWVVFTASVAVEIVRVATSGRVAITLPGLGLPQAVAGALIAAALSSAASGVALASGALATRAPVAPVVVSGASERGVQALQPDAAASDRGGSERGGSERGGSERGASERAASPLASTAHVHRVALGDDLWSLAQRYYGSGSQWRKIMQANPALLAGDPTADLPIGTLLTIDAPEAEGYTVQPGDTLWHLAEQRLGDGARFAEIAEGNAELVGDPDYIEAGWTLQLPSPEAASSDAADSGAADPNAPASVPRGRAGVGAPIPDADGHGASAPTSAATPSPDTVTPSATTPTPATGTPTSPAPAAASAAAPAAPTASALPGAPTVSPTPTATPDADPPTGALDAPAVRLALGGLAALAASGVLGGVLAGRRERLLERGLGRTFPDASAELQRFETALGLAGAPSPSDADGPAPGPTPELVARAMRLLADHWWGRRTRPPRLRRAVLTPEHLLFQFAEAIDSAPDCFTADADDALCVSWRVLQGERDVERTVAYPGLVTLGEDADGHVVMVDVVTWGALAVDGTGDLPLQPVSAMIVELSCSPWADELTLHVVTHDPRFVEAAAVEHVACVREVATAVADLERDARERHAMLVINECSYDSLRLDPDRSDAWAPAVYLFEVAPDADQLARIRLAVDGERLGLAAVLPSSDAVGAAPTAQPGPRLTLTTAPDGRLTGVLEPERLTVAAQTLTSETRDAVVALLTTSRSAETLPASWWHEDADQGLPSEPLAVVTPMPRLVRAARTKSVGLSVSVDVPDVDATLTRLPSAGPRLRLFGPVRLENAAGDQPAKAHRRCLEYCAWLLHHPGATASEMSAALFVTDGTRRSNISRLRAWLGTTPTGALYLPEAYSGRLALDEAVTSDVGEVRRLLADGVNRCSPERLRAALGHVSGAPLADAAPGEWAWAGALRDEMIAMVRDAAVVLARAELSRGALDAARWACERGRLVAPDDELLGCELMLVEDEAGRPDAVAAVLAELQRSAGRRGVDLPPETVALAQRLVEGASRVALPTG